MSVLGIVLLVIFCIVSVLLIFLVAIQDEKSTGLGGVFGSGAQTAFGGKTGSFIIKATTSLAVIFMVLSLVVAILNKSSEADVLKAIEAHNVQAQQTTTWLPENTAANTDVTTETTNTK